MARYDAGWGRFGASGGYGRGLAGRAGRARSERYGADYVP
jgi:hypothetical protein